MQAETKSKFRERKLLVGLIGVALLVIILTSLILLDASVLTEEEIIEYVSEHHQIGIINLEPIGVLGNERLYLLTADTDNGEVRFTVTVDSSKKGKDYVKSSSYEAEYLKVSISEKVLTLKDHLSKLGYALNSETDYEMDAVQMGATSDGDITTRVSLKYSGVIASSNLDDVAQSLYTAIQGVVSLELPNPYLHIETGNGGSVMLADLGSLTSSDAVKTYIERSIEK